MSRSFLETPSLLSSLYLLLLRLQARDYAGVFALTEACATDESLAPDEQNTLDALGLVEDAHPDAHACRCQLSLVSAGRWQRAPTPREQPPKSPAQNGVN